MNSKTVAFIVLICLVVFFGRMMIGTATWFVTQMLYHLVGIAAIVVALWALSTLLRR